jgi:hypothetical protein
LTREVFLPDQSDAHTTSSAKTAQELFGKNTVDICARIVQNVRLKKRTTISAFCANRTFLSTFPSRVCPSSPDYNRLL